MPFLHFWKPYRRPPEGLHRLAFAFWRKNLAISAGNISKPVLSRRLSPEVWATCCWQSTIICSSEPASSLQTRDSCLAFLWVSLLCLLGKMCHMAILLEQNQIQTLQGECLCVPPTSSQHVSLLVGHSSAGHLIAREAFLGLGIFRHCWLGKHRELARTEEHGKTHCSKNLGQSTLPSFPCGLEKRRKTDSPSTGSQGSSWGFCIFVPGDASVWKAFHAPVGLEAAHSRTCGVLPQQVPFAFLSFAGRSFRSFCVPQRKNLKPKLLMWHRCPSLHRRDSPAFWSAVCFQQPPEQHGILTSHIWWHIKPLWS